MASIKSIFLPPLLDPEINVYPYIPLGNPHCSRTLGSGEKINQETALTEISENVLDKKGGFSFLYEGIFFP